MIEVKEKSPITFFFGVILGALGVFLSAQSLPEVGWTLMQLSTLLACFGLLCCFFIPKDGSHSFWPDMHTKGGETLKLWGAQIGLFFLTLCLFFLLEQQTGLNARLQPLTPGLVFNVLQSEFLSCALVPYTLYAIVGVGLVYFSCFLGRSPVISQAIFPRVRKHPQRFLKSFTYDIVDSVMRVPFVIVTSFTLIWFCESVNAFFGWDPILQFPFRSTLIFSLVMLVFHKSNAQLIAWMDKNKMPVGKVLILYVLGFSFFLIWLNMTAKWFSFGQEMIDPVNALKSPLVGSFSPDSLQTRLTLFFWGWGMVWIPWMASVVARCSIGLPIGVALLRALIVPLIIYMGIYHFATVEHWIEFCTFIQGSSVRFLILMGLVIYMWKGWGNLRNTAEVSRGAMLPIGHSKALPLTMWMRAFSFWFMCNMIAFIMLGWIPTQITVTLGGLFMVLVMIFFIFALASSLYRGEAVKKYRVQEQS